MNADNAKRLNDLERKNAAPERLGTLLYEISLRQRGDVLAVTAVTRGTRSTAVATCGTTKS
jgi:hypothetical protein